MRETLGTPGRLSCSDVEVLLEKRISEEALSEGEQEGVRRHLDECRKCHALVKWISALPEYADELSDDEIRSAYRAAKQNQTYPQWSEHRGKIAAAVAVAAAAVIALGMLDGGWLKSLFPKVDDVTPAMLDCSPAAPREPVPGVTMTYCKDEEPGALVENGGELRVSLRTGAVGMRIDPNRRNKRKVTVETPEGEVRVKGTVFTVRVSQNQTRVEVFRGIVEFVPAASQEDTLYVTAGRGADLGRRAIFELLDPQTTVLRQTLETAASRRYASNPMPDLGSTSNAPAPRVMSGATGSPESTSPTGSVAQRVLAERPQSSERGARAQAEDAEKRSAPSIDALIQDAQSCLIAHDWKCASSRYQDVLTRYPGRPESTAVLVSLAKIELRHLDLPKKALDHYITYQRRAPGGPMAEEALFGIAETYRRLGDRNLEEETLRLFVERYPGSSQIKRARARLRRLGAAPRP